MKKISFCLLLSLWLFKSLGQGVTNNTLKIGDTLNGIYDDPLRSILFENQEAPQFDLLLLDFWSINCTSCIKAMPKLDSLQKEFGDKIKIVLITENSNSEVDRLFSKIKTPRPKLRMVVSDTLLIRKFPHTIVPHHVWVDKNKIVRFITDGHNATRENIRSFLNERALSLHLKNDLIDFDPEKSLLQLGSDLINSYSINYSFFLQRLDQFAGGQFGFDIDSVNKTAGLKFINQPLFEFYKFAFSRGPMGDYYYQNRVLLEVSDKTPFYEPVSENLLDEWNRKNLFCYESSVPLERKNELFGILVQDLNRTFPYYASIEKRLMKCLVLVKKGSTDKLSSKGGQAKFYKTTDTLQLQNYDIEKGLISPIKYANQALNAPVVNETGLKGKIDIKILSRLNNIEQLRKELIGYGLDLIESETEIEMLVIKDRK